MSENKIIYMANQIATFFHSKPEPQGVAGIAEHINKFWESRMRREFFNELETNEAAFDPWVIKAASSVNRPTQSDPHSP